ncbi:hypothetical protein [Falsiporphyromonas endometrii]|uniref:Uncharacterized protein n=1 Tax=Falsiporphyromonas endometrii TaxID=1387297 RepID=A0ABV9K774_9PORP
MKKSFIFILTLLIVSGIQTIYSCTTAVISGKFTKNGRAMLWKVRDTEEYDNYVKRFAGPNGYFIGLVNSSDPEGNQIWGGHNSKGFAIINSASFNVNMEDESEVHDLEGYVMKRALEICSNLQDFEHMLDTLKRPMGLAAHMGVIDALGGAAFYEVNNYTWTKYDANDPNVAPRGYILRTNYSKTGKKDIGYGYIRMQAASHLFDQIPIGKLTTEEMVCHLSRSMYHGLLETDYRQMAIQNNAPHFINSDDLICRFGTSSMILIEGVTKGMDSELTTSWIQVGLPFTSAVIPVWTWQEVPNILKGSKKDHLSTMGLMASQLKNLIYPLKTAERERYLRLDLLITPDNNGICQKIEQIESPMIAKIEEIETSDKQIPPTKKKGLLSEEVDKYIDQKVIPLYRSMLSQLNNYER